MTLAMKIVRFTFNLLFFFIAFSINDSIKFILIKKFEQTFLLLDVTVCNSIL